MRDHISSLLSWSPALAAALRAFAAIGAAFTTFLGDEATAESGETAYAERVSNLQWKLDNLGRVVMVGVLTKLASTLGCLNASPGLVAEGPVGTASTIRLSVRVPNLHSRRLRQRIALTGGPWW